MRSPGCINTSYPMVLLGQAGDPTLSAFSRTIFYTALSRSTIAVLLNHETKTGYARDGCVH